MVEIAVKTTFRTNYYKWSCGIYKQMAGGPIGLRASSSIAKLCMEIWLGEFRRKLEQAGVKVWLLRKFLDNVIFVCSMMRGDRILEDGVIARTPETLEDHIRNGNSKEQNTLKVLEKVAPSILPFLDFTGEAAVGNQGIPVLDTKMWYGAREG